VHRSDIDGVPVFWKEGPAPLSAGLVFGVGQRDEGFVDGGVTHLAEHLIMSSLPKSHLDRNASVSPSATEFTATGRPSAVAEFLGDVCRAMGALPLERLAAEGRILAAEEARKGGDLLGELFLRRYGATGLGRLGLRQPALAEMDRSTVLEHARRWFVRGNAVLWLTGPPPEGLVLPLPAGAAPARPPQRRTDLALPGQQRYAGPDLAVSFEAFESEALLTALRLVRERLEERLRHIGGHSYDVDFDVEDVDDGLWHVAFFCDAASEELTPAAEGLWEELTRFAEDGPTAAELAHDVSGFREYLEDPRAAQGAVMAAALRHLSGKQALDDAERLRALDSLTAAELAAALAPGLSTALVLLPDEAPTGVLSVLPELPEGSADEVEGVPHKRRRRSDPPRGSVLVAGPQGVTIRLKDGFRITARYDDCVAVGVPERDHPHLELLTADGLTLTLCEEDWKGARGIVAAADAATAHLPRFVARR
jgi:predicted Zn-dependent peptidase